MSLPVLASKLMPPRYAGQATGGAAPVDILGRPGLLQRISAAPQGQTILVYAPEGSGKTSLLSDWAKQDAASANPGITGWLTFDEGDNDPARFLAGLAMALNAAQPGLGVNVCAALEAPQPPNLPELLSRLLREISAVQAQIMLVLDDFEKLNTPRIHQATVFLANNLPPNARLVISVNSVSLPPLVGDIILMADWTVISPDELRFTSAETMELLNKQFRVKISAEQADLLTERAHGLALGIHMAGLALQRNPHPDQVWQAMDEASTPILSFLTDIILERQMEAVREFLVFTSILTRLTGELCDDVLRASPGGLQAPGRGRVTLEYLVKNHLLTTCVDVQGEWFRYHPIFASLLRERLAKNHPGLRNRLHQRASQWLEVHGDVEAAFMHALAGDDEERAAQIIEPQVLSLLGGGQISTILTWLGRLAADLVLRKPWLCLAEAWVTAYEGWKLGVDTLLMNVELAIPAMTPALAQRARGHIAAIRIQLLPGEREALHREELARLALELLPHEDRSIRCFISTHLGLELRQRGRLESAAEAFTEAIACAAQSSYRESAVNAYCRLADLHMAEGRLQKVLVLSEEALGIALTNQTEKGYPLLPAGLAHIYAGLVLYERDELDSAQGHIENGIALCTAWGELDAAFMGQVMRAAILNARGNIDKARQAAADAALLLERARQDRALQVAQLAADPSESQVFYLHTQLSRAEARLAGLHLGWKDVEAAGKWLAESRYGADDSFGFHQAFMYIFAGKVMLAQGRILEARRLSRRLSMVCESAGANYSLIHALVLQSHLMQLSNDYNGALASLKRALLLAENEKMVRPFVDTLYDVSMLLKRISEGGQGSAYARTILAVVERQAYRSDGTSDYSGLFLRPQTRPLPPLEQAGELTFTDREKEILRLLSNYQTVLEIASRLDISDRTADTIVRNICRKLGVREPSQAVVVARTMKLI